MEFFRIIFFFLLDDTNPFNDIECLALLKSDNFEFKIKKREISFGRTSDTINVDLDLSTVLNDPKKVSRNQGVIKFNELAGEFFIYNNSDKAIFVDGKILLKLCKTQLHDKSIVQISSFSCIFFINFNRILPIQNETKKLLVK